jgi:hypothetical protein
MSLDPKAHDVWDDWRGGWANANKISGALLPIFGYFGSILLIFGAVISWAYQTASARLGVVDLFACEISTVCRVGTAFDIGKRYVDRYNSPVPQNDSANNKEPASYVSHEDYFPIFNNNSRDLQALEASVVRHITEFYTYMKAVRDSQRKLATIKLPLGTTAAREMEPSKSMTEADSWHETNFNVIYLLFLAYESGRTAINELVEFEPTNAECMIVILITELKCYCFLLSYFNHDNVRYLRLKLREETYKNEVPNLFQSDET